MGKSTVQSWKDFLDEETVGAKGQPRIRQGGLFTTTYLLGSAVERGVAERVKMDPNSVCFANP